MSEASLRARSRARTETRMTDTCTIRRPGAPTYDDDLGTVTPTWEDLHEGPCRTRQPGFGSGSANRTEVGEASVLLQAPEVHLPMTAPVLRPGDEITITASEGDPQAVGRVFLVRAVPAFSGATARRYGVTERTS